LAVDNFVATSNQWK